MLTFYKQLTSNNCHICMCIIYILRSKYILTYIISKQVYNIVNCMIAMNKNQYQNTQDCSYKQTEI